MQELNVQAIFDKSLKGNLSELESARKEIAKRILIGIFLFLLLKFLAENSV